MFGSGSIALAVGPTTFHTFDELRQFAVDFGEIAAAFAFVGTSSGGRWRDATLDARFLTLLFARSGGPLGAFVEMRFEFGEATRENLSSVALVWT